MNEKIEILRAWGVAKANVVPEFKACRCGDSLQTVRVPVPNHGAYLYLYLGWCMDCLEVQGSILVDPK